MVKRVVRKLELFAIHAHHDTASTYVDLFDKLSRVQRARRVIEISGIVIGFPIVRARTDGLFIRATEGDPDSSALVFDRETGRTRETDLSKSEVLSQTTHLYVVPEKRRAAIEYSRRGVKAALLGPAMEGILRANYSELHNIRLEFTAVPTKGFLEEVKQFERIREASIRLMKPNASWTDHYTDLSDLMDDSNGAKVELDVRAGRGESLRKNRGIVKVIKDVAADEQPYLDEAKLIGTRENETNETTLRSSQHLEHTRTVVEADDAGVPLEGSMRTALVNFIQRFV